MLDNKVVNRLPVKALNSCQSLATINAFYDLKEVVRCRKKSGLYIHHIAEYAFTWTQRIEIHTDEGCIYSTPMVSAQAPGAPVTLDRPAAPDPAQAIQNWFWSITNDAAQKALTAALNDKRPAEAIAGYMNT